MVASCWGVWVRGGGGGGDSGDKGGAGGMFESEQALCALGQVQNVGDALFWGGLTGMYG